ncbi:MAG: DUF4093 domain-containing protein [Clostridia bacterium]|nr:DUF4093 domain-containing protein [Clostridia bacterium]
MIHLKEAVIVEGKYDKIKLKNFIDAEIITTDGFGIFKNKEKVNMLRRIAEKRGIIILTDSDSAGFIIRGHLTSVIDPKFIKNVFVPEIKGKERRKEKASAQGLLGVEGLSEEIIVESLKKAGIGIDSKTKETLKITSTDLFRLGLSGGDNSREMREKLLKSLDLPVGMSTRQMLTALNSLYSLTELEKILEESIDENR